MSSLDTIIAGIEHLSSADPVRVLLGSTAEAVLRHAQCNVLAVPTSLAVPYAGVEARAPATVPWAGPLAPAVG